MENANGFSARAKPVTSEDENPPAGDRHSLREDIQKVDEPQLKAMFETSAEVLGGLIKAFGDYEKKNEAAWRR
jgi:hypothetical protein